MPNIVMPNVVMPIVEMSNVVGPIAVTPIVVTPIVVMVSVLVGCGPVQFGALQTPTKIHRKSLVDCRAAWPDAKRKPVTPYVRCLNAANRKWIAAAEPLNADLVEVAARYRIEQARHYDSGEIGWSTYQLRVAEKRAALQSVRIARLNQIKRANAAADRADAAHRRVFEQALAREERSQRQARTAGTAGNKTCWRRAGRLNCPQ